MMASLVDANKRQRHFDAKIARIGKPDFDADMNDDDFDNDIWQAHDNI